MSHITDAEFCYVRELVREHAAIALGDSKAYLVEARLMPLADEQGLSGVSALIEQLQSQPIGPLHQRTIEALTTNETSFFRDIHPFDALKDKLLAEMVAARADEQALSIWSAACSTGQEPYSIAMVVKEHFASLDSWKIRIMASDISTEALDQGRSGQYSQLEVNRGLPAQYLVKYFDQVGSRFQVSEELRRMVQFGSVNLVRNWPALPQLDLVFLRNVLIYFDVDTKRDVLARVRDVLRPDGYLILGSAETTLGLDECFERVELGRATCYRLRG